MGFQKTLRDYKGSKGIQRDLKEFKGIKDFKGFKDSSMEFNGL